MTPERAQTYLNVLNELQIKASQAPLIMQILRLLQEDVAEPKPDTGEKPLSEP